MTRPRAALAGVVALGGAVAALALALALRPGPVWYEEPSGRDGAVPTEAEAALRLCRREAATDVGLGPQTAVRLAIAHQSADRDVLVDVEFETPTAVRYVCHLVPHRGGFLLLRLTRW